MKRRSLLAVLALTTVCIVASSLAISRVIFTWEKTFEVGEPEVECEIEIGNQRIIGCPVTVWVSLKPKGECNLEPKMTIRIEACPINDDYSRFHGLSIDEPLPMEWWKQNGYTFKIAGESFIYETTVSLETGEHYVEYAPSSSALHNLTWHASIYINDFLMAEGDVRRDTRLRAYFISKGGEEGCSIEGNYSPELCWHNETSEDWQHVMYLKEETNMTLTCQRHIEEHTFTPILTGEYKVVVTFAMDSEICTFSSED